MRYLCFFERSGVHRDLHLLTPSFPTRRSSDLSTVAKTRRQDRPGTETNGGVDQCLLRGTPGYWAGKTSPTSVVSAAFTVTSSTKRSAALMPSGRTWMRYSPTGMV